MAEDLGTAKLIQSITDSMLALRTALVDRMDRVDTEHRASLQKVADGLNTFMLTQAALNPQLATRERVETISDHFHTMASTVSAHEARLVKVEARLERLSSTVTTQLAELLAGQSDLRGRVDRQMDGQLLPEERLFIEQKRQEERQRLEDRRQHRRIWHESLSKGLIGFFLLGGLGTGILGYVIHYFVLLGSRPHP